MNISLQQNGINKPAFITTVVVHVLLLLLFFIWKFSPPVQSTVTEEFGIEVNIGTDLDGSGDDQPLHVDAPAPEATGGLNAASASRAIEAAKSMMLTQDANAPAVKPQPIENGRTITTENKSLKRNTNHNNSNSRANNDSRSRSTTTTTSPTAKYSYPGGSGAGGNSAQENRAGTGEGDGSGNGDKGVPGGTPGATTYSGIPGSGNVGVGHSLADRRIVAYPDKEAEFRDGGTVVIRVTVNREGRIIAKQVKSTSGAALTRLALKKAEQIRFDKNLDAPVEQFGNITFVFKARG